MDNNVADSKVQLVKDFSDFLKNENVFAALNYRDNGKIFMVKVPYSSKIDILYSTHSYRDSVFDLHSSLKYSGIYDKVNDKLYDLDYTIRYNIFDYDSTRNILDKSDIYKEINDVVGKRVRELVENDKVNLFGKDFIAPEPKSYDIPTERDVNIYFIDGLTSETLKDQFRNYSTDKSEDVLDYISEPEIFVEEESREYILGHLEDIYLGLFRCQEERKLLKKIEDDKEKPIHRVKTIIDSIRDKNYKTVNLTINKDGIEQTFKYDTDALLCSYNSSYLSTYNFVSARERAEFEENFGRNVDLHYEDIIKITYGKNVVFEDSNFKEKEELCL